MPYWALPPSSMTAAVMARRRGRQTVTLPRLEDEWMQKIEKKKKLWRPHNGDSMSAHSLRGFQMHMKRSIYVMEAANMVTLLEFAITNQSLANICH